MVHLDGDVPPPRPGDRNRVAGNGTRHGECLRCGSWVQRVSNSDSDVMQSRCSGPRMLDSHRHWWIWTHQFFTKYGLPALRQHTHTHPFNDPFSGTRKVKPIWILLKQQTVSGSGISWDICMSAPRSRQTTTPAPHHSVFYRPDALPAAQQRQPSDKMAEMYTVHFFKN